MKLRVNYRTANPAVFKALMELEKAASSSGIDPITYELIKLRASQINGCAFCLDMHSEDLMNKGESMQRIMLLSVWREAPIYTEKECAVLELTEHVTQVSETGVPDELYNRVRDYYDEAEYTALILAIITINSWNRIAISTSMFPGCFD